VEKIKVRSPLTCRTKLGMCQLCYGMDLSNGNIVEEGLAVGIIAAQSIGEPGTQLTMRTFHIGGTASRDVEESEVRTRHPGRIRFERVRSVGPDGEKIALGRNGEIVILELVGREGRERELERYRVPNGARLMVQEWDSSDPECEIPEGAEGDGLKGIKGVCREGQPLCQWDPHSVPIIAEVGGKVKLENCKEGKTINVEIDPSGNIRRTVMEYKGEKHPQISLVDNSGETQAFYYLPEKASIEVDEGQKVAAGDLLAKTPREAGGTQDITGGLPRVTELFEARRPKDPAVIAEIDGEIELAEETRRNQRVINVHPPDEAGEPRAHLIPHGKQLLVHAKDLVRHGDALVRGPLVPHDILRVSGVESVQQYLMHEIQNVYRSQRVDIDDKHIEIVIGQMLRKVRVEDAGDTHLLEGVVIDKIEFQETNEQVRDCVKVAEPGDTDFKSDDIVPKEVFDEVNAEIEASGETPATKSKPQEATMTIQLLGITKAAVQSESFVSAASFQETTKVLTEAALAGKNDLLVGLKENVILGHLVPAGTGFHMHQDSEVRIRPEALLELEAEKERLRLARMKMYNGEEEAAAAAASTPPTPAAEEPAQEAPGK
ncbi:MAG TPA: DNA-directed RNA polymerase subunit beta', partial [Planctomycetaceae bacterium]|nr:DNA-directed RNA polymerase subunit beta' [Planctomycetaceae bacterium]